MKEFEDQWEEAGGGICGKRACEKYYRAALKLVLGWLDYSTEHKEIEDKIYEELGEWSPIKIFSQKSQNYFPKPDN